MAQQLKIAAIVLLSAAALATPVPKAETNVKCHAFRQESSEKPGVFNATLLLASPHVLHGVWIRLIFDNPINGLRVTGIEHFEVRAEERSTSFLIKNPKLLLKSGEKNILRLVGEYNGDKVPNLVEYRVNGVSVCPPDESFRNLTDIYLGDSNEPNFLNSVIMQQKPEVEPSYKCGVFPQNDKTSPPWQNALFIKIEEKTEYPCEAILITDKHFITNAHCVTFVNTRIPVPSDYLQLFFGSFTPHLVSKITVHPGYRPQGLLNDLAVLELENPVEISDTIRPICLPEEASLENRQGLVAGFNNNRTRTVERVQEIDVAECAKRLEPLISLLGDGTQCASYIEENSEGCVGQSGSSVVALKKASDNQYELSGIVTVGSGLQGENKCNKDTTIILTNVSLYLKWIRSVL